MTCPTEQQVNEARAVLRADYYFSVRELAKSLAAEIKAGEFDSREAFFDRIHEECDGSYWVIYTHAAWQCLYVSDNDSAHEDVGAELSGEGSMRVSQQAFYALQQDLFESFTAINVDINADETFEKNDEDAA